MQKISDFVNGNGRSITVGEFEVRELADGSYFIEHESGEGTQVSKEIFEGFIKELYNEVF